MNLPFVSGCKSNFCNRWQILPLSLGILSLTACQSAVTPDKLTRTITVSGKGDVTIPTTITQARLGVEVQGKTTAEVQQEVARRSSAVVELLKARKVEKLQTTGINLNPIYSYTGGKQRIDRYSGSNIVSFEIDNDKAGNILDQAIAAGATRIDGVSFVASDEAIAEAEKQAIKEASEDATNQAESALSALNLSQKEIVGVQINGANPPIPPTPVFDQTARTLSQKDVVTPVIGGEQKVASTVTLQIRY